jgi:hypothetical protein
MTKLTDTQLIVLSSAAKHNEGLATRPANLNAAAAMKVASSLIDKGLVREIRAKTDAPVWHVSSIEPKRSVPKLSRFRRVGARVLKMICGNHLGLPPIVITGHHPRPSWWGDWRECCNPGSKQDHATPMTGIGRCCLKNSETLQISRLGGFGTDREKRPVCGNITANLSLTSLEIRKAPPGRRPGWVDVLRPPAPLDVAAPSMRHRSRADRCSISFRSTGGFYSISLTTAKL